MSMNGYDVQTQQVETDARMWGEVSNKLASASSDAQSVHLDENQLSFASQNGMAAAYGQVVEAFARLTQEGQQEAQQYSQTLSQIAQNYSTTDTSSAGVLNNAGAPLNGGA